MDRSEAERLVEEWLERRKRRWLGRPALDRRRTEEHPFGWVCHYIREIEPADVVPGADTVIVGPGVIVDRTSGALVETGSAYPPSAYLSCYAREGSVANARRYLRASEDEPFAEFGVAGVAHRPSWAVFGRCYKGPLGVGTRFTNFVDAGGVARDLLLEVVRIEAYGHVLDDIDTGLTARLFLRGDGGDLLRGEGVLRAT